MKNIKLFFILSIFLLLTFVNSQEQTCIYFFQGEGCQHCAKIEPILDNLAIQNQDYQVHKFEIYNNRTNLLILNNYFDIYNISTENRGIPVILIGEEYLIGDKSIIENLENTLKSNLGAKCPDFEKKNGAGKISETSPADKLNTLSLLTVIGAAFVDSINPCAIAVLLILMSALLSTGNKIKTLQAGIAFTISIYIAYFLFGIGLFSAIQISGLSYWFYKVIGVLAIILGLANIKDFIWYGAGGFVCEIPRKWRPKLKELLGKVTSPLGAFLMGFLVCLFELPCTGGPYIVILGLLADRMTMWASLPLLLIYNLVFVLPLLLITFLIYFGFANVENATKWKDNNLRILHLIAGIIILTLGILITFGFI